MTKLSIGQFRQTIEEYFDNYGMDVVCRKRRRGFSLYVEGDDQPVARLCPTDEDDEVEIHWWDGSHWQPVAEFGLVLPLTEALEYITDDSEGVFFGESDVPDYDGNTVQPLTVSWVVHGAFQLLVPHTMCYSLLGGTFGGMVSGAPWGALCGAGAALAFCVLHSLLRDRFRGVTFALLFSGLPSMVLAGASGAVGAAVCRALGGGLWPGIGGAFVAAVCAYLCTFGSWPAWLVGFATGLNLGISLTDWLEIREQFLGVALIALLAVCIASLCREIGNAILAAIRIARRKAVS